MVIGARLFEIYPLAGTFARKGISWSAPLAPLNHLRCNDVSFVNSLCPKIAMCFVRFF